MAIAGLGTPTGTNAGFVTGLTHSHTLVSGSDRIIVVFVGTELTGTTITVSGVTYGGVAMTQLASASAVGAANNHGAMWYLLSASLPADGANNVISTFSAQASDSWQECLSYSGASQTAPSGGNVDTTGEGSPGDATIENDISAIAATSWALSYAQSGNVGSFAAGQTQDEVVDFQSASMTHQVAEKRGGGGETQLTSAFTGTNNRLIRLCAVWAAAGAGAATSDSFESAARRQLRMNPLYRMSPRSEREAQQFLRAQKRAYGFASAA